MAATRLRSARFELILLDRGESESRQIKADGAIRRTSKLMENALRLANCESEQRPDGETMAMEEGMKRNSGDGQKRLSRF